MRKKIYSIIDCSSDENIIGQYYDAFMFVIIIISLVPLAFKSTNDFFDVINVFSTLIFLVDYILRWITADFKFDKKSPISFVIYPFTPMAIIDLVAILTVSPAVSRGFRLFKAFRLMRVLRILRTMKFVRYSKNLIILADVLKKESKTLGAVATLAVAYILISALVIFNVEPDSFNSFFDAIYWATVSLTTVGYGDIYPTTNTGRIVTMISSLFGIAIIALPSGVITGGYIKEINEDKKDESAENVDNNIIKE